MRVSSLSLTLFLLLPVTAAAQESRVHAVAGEFAADIHSKKGMGCESCHTGVTQADVQNPAAASKFVIQRERIPQLCGSCHADVKRIKQLDPQAKLRSDQLELYGTSAHGIKFTHGDTRVAVCTDCHSTHTIRPSSDPLSSVHPMNVAKTCERCHADTDYMKPYHVATDQFAGYSASVHHQAMVAAGDLSAPTCTTCHGSHGAAPAGLKAAADVCITCHVQQAKFFEESPHKEAFALLAAPSCITCHTSHLIRHPDDAFVGTGAHAVCSDCHSKADPAGKAADGIHERFQRLESEIAGAQTVIDRAQLAGMDVEAAQLQLAQATGALAKARVTVHTARLVRVDAEVAEGSKIAAAAFAGGEAALKERDHRRKSVILPLFAIAALMVALGAYLREIEKTEVAD
jgi:predicted CXXCH cytochrome family protein